MIKEYVHQVERFSTIKPTNVLEIGALDGRYARILQRRFAIADNKIHLVEPNPRLHKRLIKKFPDSMVHHVAILDTRQKYCELNRVVSNKRNELGCSSLLDRTSNKWNDYIMAKQQITRVPAVSGSLLLDQISYAIDLCIIDVEGLSYDVLKSFGKKLVQIKSLMVECEHAELFKNQRLFSDVEKILVRNGFTLMAFQFSYPNQSDSIWIQRKLVNF